MRIRYQQSRQSGPGGLTITLPTTANRDQGVFLVCLGFAAYPACWLALQLFGWFSGHRWDELGIWSGSVLVLLGMYLLFSSRKTVQVAQECITLQDGIGRPVVHIRWKGEASVKLRAVPTEERGRLTEFWEIHLQSGKEEYTVDRRINHQLETRAAAEAIAKALGIPLIDTTGDGEPITIQAADMDLPFRQRAAKYPQLLGRPVNRPPATAVQVESVDGATMFTWGVGTTGIVTDVLSVGALFLLFAVYPFPGSQHGENLLSVALSSGNYFGFIAMGAVLGIAILLVLGLRYHLTVDATTARFQEFWWGIPITSTSMPLKFVEEIYLHAGVRGREIQLLGDARGIIFRVSEQETARWLVSEIRRSVMTGHVPEIPPAGVAASAGGAPGAAG